jgi:hypothetical protein
MGSATLPVIMYDFKAKYYEDTSLAYWVERLSVANKFQYEDIVWDHADDIVESGEKAVDFHHYMRWVMFTWGWVIETRHVDDEQTTTVETLVSYNGKTAVITHRERYGPSHTEMKPYPRDNVLPVPSRVRLLSCK